MVQNDSWKWLITGFKIDLETQVKPKTAQGYCDHVSYFARWVENNDKGVPGSITKRDLQEFLHYVASTPAIFTTGNGAKRIIQRDENSRWHHYFPLKRFFAWATAEGYLSQNPIDTIILKPPKAAPIEPYRAEHIDAFLKILEYEWKNATTTLQKMLAARNKAIISLLLDSFIRLDECYHLKISDIDMNKNRVQVRKSKTDKSRVAGFGPQTKKALWRYLGLRGDGLGHDALWITEEGRPLGKHGIQDVVRRLKRDTGLRGLKGSVHKLRHTGATVTLKHTRDMKGLKLLLGHSTLAMTERYTQYIEAEDALQAYDGKGPLDWLTD